jgi:nicotinamide-nucleotide amidase
MFSSELLSAAASVLDTCRVRGLKITTAESCTGGLISALLTEIAGSSDVFERGFVTYSNEAKSTLLGVSHDLLRMHGAVSCEVAAAMAEGALRNALADVSVAVTGIAGPGGGSLKKPVGLVYVATARKGRIAATQRFEFPPVSRQDIRINCLREALRLLTEVACG